MRHKRMLIPALLLFTSLTASTATGQEKRAAVAAGQPVAMLTRTTTRHEIRRLGYGGTVTLIGAPAGSITVESWNRGEVDITAEIELQAGSEEDLAVLATVNSFIIDSTMNHLRIMTIGTHDKALMKKTAKNFPKRLIGLPFKINYKLKVPAMIDLEVDAGRGPLDLGGVEGSVTIKALESDANLVFTGGTVRAVIGAGKVNIAIPARSWRGAGADVQLALGQLNVKLLNGFNGDVNATVLRSGKIENGYEGLSPLEDGGQMTDRQVQARAGAGGAKLSFTVTDGTLKLEPLVEQ